MISRAKYERHVRIYEGIWKLQLKAGITAGIWTLVVGLAWKVYSGSKPWPDWLGWVVAPVLLPAVPIVILGSLIRFLWWPQLDLERMDVEYAERESLK